MTSVWVVIPTFNEAENLESLVAAVLAALASEPGVEGSVLVVDDDSPDGTGVIAGGLSRRHAAVHVLHREGKRGLGRAYVAGFEYALGRGADYVMEMDADFSHAPADLPRLLRPARAGADLVIGSRYVRGGGVEGWPVHRRLISRAGSLYARTVLGCAIRDMTGGFKCYRAAALCAIDLGSMRSEGYAFQVETNYAAWRRRCTIVEVPIVFRDRERGQSKMSLAIAVEAVWRVPMMRRAGHPAAVVATARATG